MTTEVNEFLFATCITQTPYDQRILKPMKTNKVTQFQHFTLVELLVAMGVFAILMMVLMQFFNSTQKLWTTTANKNQIFENTRMAIDLISKNIEAAYYTTDYTTPFWYYEDSANGNMIAFVATLPDKVDSACKTRIAEVKIWHDKTSDNGSLKISYTGDNNTAKWNFFNNFTVGSSSSNSFSHDPSTPSNDDNSSEPYNEILPYVTDFNIAILDEKNRNIVTDAAVSGTPTRASELRPSYNKNTATEFPYAVQIQIQSLDKDNYTKWVASGASVSNPIYISNVRTFSRYIVIGDRGQY